MAMPKASQAFARGGYLRRLSAVKSEIERRRSKRWSRLRLTSYISPDTLRGRAMFRGGWS